MVNPIRKMRELCEITSSKRIFAADYRPEGIPFYRGKEISEKYRGNLDVSTELFIDQDKFEQIRAKFGAPVAGDLLLTSVGTLGSPYVVNKGEEFYFKDGNLTWFRNFKYLDSRFLYCWLQAPQGKAELKKCTIGSSQSAYTIVLLKEMEISLPPLFTQQKIAAILRAYDDLIENNLRRIKILEEMAQSLYREWFVKFRFPGHERVRMVDSSMGKIPAAWSIVPLAQVANVNMRSIRQLDGPKRIRYVDISSVSPGRIEKIEEMDFIDAPSRARRVVRHGDTIWSSVRPNRRSFALVLNPSPNLIVSTGFAILSPTFVPYTFLYQAVTTEGFVGYLTNHATGAAYPAVSAGDFETAEILLPPTALLDRFQSIVENIETTTHNLKCKIPILRETRDLLLPKLISGEVDVSELGIAVPEEAEA